MSRHPKAHDDTEDGFLRRWSRRKARSERFEPDDTVATPPEAVEQSDGSVPAESGIEESAAQERVKADEDMPDLESITETTNMSDFFSPGVSEQLRTQALRRLFRMSKFNVLDGLDDYNEDFRNFAPLGDLVTSDMRHRMEMEEQRRRESVDAQELAEASESETETDEPVEERLGEERDEEPAAEARRPARSGEHPGTGQGVTEGDGDPRSRTET